MFDMKELTRLLPALGQELEGELLALNEETRLFGLQLSPQQISELLINRSATLARYERFEVDSEILKKIIRAFSPSPYLQQGEYAQTIMSLYELFHYIKNELDDRVGDDALINYLANAYNRRCHGDLGLLQGRETENLLHQVHFAGYQQPDKGQETEDKAEEEA